MAEKQLASKQKTVSEVQRYLDVISAYEKEFKRWEGRVDKILKRYRDDDRKGKEGPTRFNILWSNVQTLVPATFSKLPKPDVSRRFRDNDPVGRVASMILERALEFEIEHYSDYRATMKQSVYDRFLGGRGTAWARYEPHIRAVQEQLPQDGAEITEDVDTPNEELDYECAPVDYVHWKDFGHTVARTWEEVGQVWRRVYMRMEAKKERFGEEAAKKIPKDAKPKDGRANDLTASDTDDGSWIYELWDKDEKKAYWFHKGMDKFLDVRDDPLGLQEFFPCPRPLYATITNETLVPVPDFALYQDQANELDVLAERREGLIKMLQVKGVYDGSADASLGRLFTEGDNGKLLPVKNWAAFAEKNGLKGQIDVLDLTPIANALVATGEAEERVKADIYEITGISDIIRGQTVASETATAQQIKGQYATLRLKSMQESVAQFANDMLRLKAQIMCAKFDPQTLVRISAAEQLSNGDQQILGQALALLVGEERMKNPDASPGPNPMRAFRVEVAADTLVQIDEQQEKQDRMEFLTANGTFMEKATQMVAQAGPAAPAIVPVIMEMWKFGVTAFKAGKGLEGAIDEAADKLKELALNPPPPPPDPEIAKAQAEAQAEAQKEQIIAQRDSERFRMEMEREAMQAQHKQQIDAQQKAHEQQIRAMELEREESFNRWKVIEDNATKVIVAEISAKASLDQTLISAEQAANEAVVKGMTEGSSDKTGRPIEKLSSTISSMNEAVKGLGTLQQQVEDLAKRQEEQRQLVEQMKGREVVKMARVKGADGRLAGVRKHHADGSVSEVAVH